MISLAGALGDAGLSTRIAAYSDFGDKVRAAGCDFVDLEVSLADWWEAHNAQPKFKDFAAHVTPLLDVPMRRALFKPTS